MNTYITRGTCSRQIQFDVKDDDTLTAVKFIGGCPGNTQAVAKLVEGKNIDEVISLLKGIECRMGTSCPDQLARALIKYKDQHAK
ncbi:MAG: TIGR03905 family TSCPD domain-containing protein [Clostridia bacterium]|nr:TIGR03905 family TSCPD domain-containing protein [Clostridia bacterium]